MKNLKGLKPGSVVICKKDLFMLYDKENPTFKRNKRYVIINTRSGGFDLIDEQNDDHGINDAWLKHFKKEK